MREEWETPHHIEDDEADQRDAAVEHHGERQVVPCQRHGRRSPGPTK